MTFFNGLVGIEYFYLSAFLLFLLSLVTVFIAVPIFIRKLKQNGFVVPDLYKKNKPMTPTIGGLAILSGILVSLTFGIFFINNIQLLLIFYFIVFTFALFGILDDLVNVGRVLKIFAPFFMALPIALINTDSTLWLGFGQIELGLFCSFIIAPLYVMVVSNLVNMHSGYNGLQTGLSSIVIFFLIVLTILRGQYSELVYIMPLFGGLLAFFWYNKYPSQIFEGNSGALAIGSAMGAYIVLIGVEILGVILLIPHIVNFLLYGYWKIKKIPNAKFGFERDDNTICVPNPLTLKWVLPYYYDVSEKQATYFMYGITFIFGLVGVIICL